MKLTFDVVKKNWKRYLWSSLITFIAGFLLVFVPQMESITLESFKDGSFNGLVFLAVRAGLKALLEVILFIVTKK